MHAATLTSARLQRVLAVLSDGQSHTTRDIVRKGRVMAVSACISELRVCGAEIDCVRVAIPGGHGWRFYYTMTKAPK
jgi:hypothetical protein